MIFETVTDVAILWLFGGRARQGMSARVRKCMQGGLSVECWRRSRGVLRLGVSQAASLGLHNQPLFEN
jgi:hypothetical protein